MEDDKKIARFKNPYFWVILLGANVSFILAYFKIEPTNITTWGYIKEIFLEFIKNPHLVISCALMNIGIFLNPTTKGIKD